MDEPFWKQYLRYLGLGFERMTLREKSTGLKAASFAEISGHLTYTAITA